MGGQRWWRLLRHGSSMCLLWLRLRRQCIRGRRLVDTSSIPYVFLSRLLDLLLSGLELRSVLLQYFEAEVGQVGTANSCKDHGHHVRRNATLH